MATRIKEKYLAEAVPALQQKFGYKNVMEIPKLDKIVINMGLGDCKDNAKAFEMAINELTTIAGQKPMVTKAKKSIANFKLREGQNIGAKVTCAAPAWKNSWTSWSTLRCPASVTSAAFPIRLSMAAAITPSAFVSSCSSRNRVRQGRAHSRHGDDLRDHRQDRRRVQGAAASAGHALRAGVIRRRTSNG